MRVTAADGWEALSTELSPGGLSAKTVLTRYCRLLYQRHRSYEKVARRTELDRCTVRKYVVERGASNTDEAIAGLVPAED